MAKDKVEVDVITNTKGSTKSIGKYALGVGGAVLAVKALVKIGKDLSAAYFTQEKAETKLTSAIKATGKSHEISTRSMKEYAAQLQQVTIYGDEATLSAMAMLQQLGNLGENELKDVTKATQDFASAMNLDLETAASLIGKTLGSSTNALTRYGVEVDMSLGKNERLAALVGEVEKKFGGAAVAMGETAFGSAEKLNNAWGDLQETGGGMMNVVLTPMRNVLVSLVTQFNDFLNSVESAETIIKRFNEAAGTDDTFVIDLLENISPLAAAIRDTSADLDEATKTLELYELGLKAGTATAVMFGDSLYIGASGTEFLTDKVEDLSSTLEDLKAQQETGSGLLTDKDKIANEAAALTTAFAAIDAAAVKHGDVVDTVKEKNALFGVALSRLAEDDFTTYGDGIIYLKKLFADQLTPAIEEATQSASTFGLMLGAGVNVPLSMPAAAPQAGTAMPPIMDLKLPTATMSEIMDFPTTLADTFAGAMEQAPLWFDPLELSLLNIMEEEDLVAQKAIDMADAFAESAKDYIKGTGLITNAFATMFQGMGQASVEGGDAMKAAMKSTFASILGGLAQMVWANTAVALALALAGDATKWAAVAQGALAGGTLSAAQGFVTAMRDGGTVTRPTLAMIGEAGPETVTRADRGGGGGVTVINHFHGTVIREREAARSIGRYLYQDARGH